ncbi:MAG: ribonuclease J [Halobacteriovoraceae bacterium]|nr:ribonuclease J [Halobacteriovoraceae bacterium]
MSFSIQPIGGLGQIGSNMMVITAPSKKTYVIDCGILFPFEDTFNINYLIPNFEDIQRPEFVIITHGHEDHIGALPHLLEKFPGLTVYAPSFAGELIRRKAEYFPRKLDFKVKTSIQDEIETDDLLFRYIQVNHSIPDTFGIVIKNKQTETTAFYISDFKVDHKVVHEPVFDFKLLDKYAKGSKKRILLADSTNITSSLRKTTSEQELLPAFKKYIDTDRRRVFITTFSSNIHRLYNLYQLAQESGRKFVLYGRSMRNYWETAVKAGTLPEGLRIYDVDDVDSQKDKLLITVSGCQGDFRSTFRRVAYNQDSKFKLNDGDLFLLSSKEIPGNEKKISQSLNELSLRGVKVVTHRDDLIHASGHAGKDDLAEVIEKFNPNTFIPIHGETFFLERHKQWIREDHKNLRSFTILNHDTFNFEKEHTIVCQEAPAPILIQGAANEISKEAIKERRKIAEGGLVVVSVFMNKDRKIDFSAKAQGCNIIEVIGEEKFNDLIRKVISKAKGELDQEELRIAIRRIVSDLTGIRPVVVIMLSL